MQSLLKWPAPPRRRRALALLVAIAAVLGALASSATARMAVEGPESLPEDYVEPQAIEWIEGGKVEHKGCHFPAYRDTVMKSDVWYTNKDGKAQVPKAGEVWYGAIHVGVFNPCTGQLPVEFHVKPPPHTSFANSSSNKIECGFIPEGGGTTFADVTADQSVCPTGVTQTAAGWSLDGRFLSKYSQFMIAFPLKSSAPLSGERLRVLVESKSGDPMDPYVADPGEPYVDVNVAQSAPTAPTAQTTLPFAALINCLWDNPNNPGPC